MTWFTGGLSAWGLGMLAWAWQQNGLAGMGRTAVMQLFYIYVYLFGLHFSRQERAGWLTRGALHAGAALLLLVQLLSLTYLVVRGFPLDPAFVLDSLPEVLPTLRNTLGDMLFVLIMGGLVVAWGVLATALMSHMRPVSKPILAYASILLGLLLWAQSYPLELLRASVPFLQPVADSSRHDHFLPFPDTQPVPAVTVTRSFRGFKSEDGAPVFIVQLESLNALALAGLATREEGLGPEQLMPQMYAAREKGVLVTHMWGASMQTQRGQGAILCSGVMDMGGGIASLPKLQSACLPAMLKADGYTTFFASAYSDGQFHNTDRLLAQMGFSERHFADKIQPGDKKWRWGADDCVFYDRYFDYFDAHPELTQSHFMAYLTVSAHHDPFYSREKYADIAPLTQGRGFLADYLNSAAAQDHCLKRFLERVEPYRQRAHVIVVGDHSWPVGLNGSTYNERGATSDNFMTPFLYLPPYDKGDAMRRGALVDTPALGQPDIFPTVLELLSGTPYRNSFAALLRQGKDGAPPALPDDYDDCQVVTQPYDGTHMGVVRGKHKVTFSVMRRRLATSRLGDDFYEFAPLEAQGNVDFGDFLNQHMCERYKYWLEPDAAAPDFAVPNLQPQ